MKSKLLWLEEQMPSEKQNVKKSLLIIGAGIYAMIAFEIADCMGCYGRIDFVDDFRKETPVGFKTVGTTSDLAKLAGEYDEVTVAIGNPEVRLALLKKMSEEYSSKIATLISPRAWVSRFAKIGPGCIVEPMAVIHPECELELGCIVSSGAVINHGSNCEMGVHVDCNATVEGYCLVPKCTKIGCGEAYREKKL